MVMVRTEWAMVKLCVYFPRQEEEMKRGVSSAFLATNECCAAKSMCRAVLSHVVSETRKFMLIGHIRMFKNRSFRNCTCVQLPLTGLELQASILRSEEGRAVARGQAYELNKYAIPDSPIYTLTASRQVHP